MQNQNIKKSENRLEHISISKIEISKTNEIFRDSNELGEKELSELIKSIQEKGIISPILLKQKDGENDKFILVCGERRLRASTYAGKQLIPAYIREMSEEEAFELQMTENLQRKDVHPLKEAKGFKYIIDNNKGFTTKDLSIKFGKSESYIIQRLKLNDLIPEAKKDYVKNSMTLSHALSLARLTEENQTTCVKEAREDNGYGSIKDFEEYIQRNIMHNLSDAPFDTTDEKLIAKTGACSTCLKRSGCSPLLFPDIKEKDRCMDTVCYDSKVKENIILRLNDVIDNHPEIYLLVNYSDLMPEVEQIIKESGKNVIKKYTDYSEHKSTGTIKAKGLNISGSEAGIISTIYLSKIKANESDNSSNNISIEKLKERRKRAIEIDQEKIYSQIINAVKSHPSQKSRDIRKQNKAEENCQIYLIIDRAGYLLKREINKQYNLDDENPEKYIAALEKLTTEEKANITRRVMIDQYSGVHPTTIYASLIRKMAESYKDIPITEFEKSQNDIREKREIRFKERLKELSKSTIDKTKLKK